MEPTRESSVHTASSNEWRELRGHAQHQTVEVLRLILILLQDAVILVAGFGAEFLYEHWLHSSEPFFQLAIRLSSAFFLLLYVITVSVHIVQYVRGQVGQTNSSWLSQYLPWAIVGGGVLAAGVALTIPSLRWRPSAETPVMVTRVAMALPQDHRLVLQGGGAFGVSAVAPLAISPDGVHLAYVGYQQGGFQMLYVRRMDEVQANPIVGTEGADQPFFSLDSQWIAFRADRVLKKVRVTGGPVVTLCAVRDSRGGTWSSESEIILAADTVSGLSRVSAAGGILQPLTELRAGEITHRWPVALPGANAVMFVTSPDANVNDDYAQIVVERLDTHERKNLVNGGTFPRYVTTGHIVFYRAGSIMAVPFDLQHLQVTGVPVPLVENVLNPWTAGSAAYAVSGNGTLAYVPGGRSIGDLNTLVWVDRNGEVIEDVKAPPRAYGTNYGGSNGPRLSPDGQRVALQILEKDKNDIWIYDLARATLTRFTFEGDNGSPLWTRDGKRVIFRTRRGRGEALVSKAADGSGPEQVLTTESNGSNIATDTSPGDRDVFYRRQTPESNRDLYILPLQGERKPQIFLKTPFNESNARVSPDGNWVAYLSDESGRFEVYIRPFHGSGGKVQVSTEGGKEMVWTRDEIFYRNGYKMMAVHVTTAPQLAVSKPRLLFERPYPSYGGLGAYYDVSSDGKRFLMLKPVQQTRTSDTQITLVLHWFEELKQKVPTK